MPARDIGEAEPRVDRGQGDWDLLLLIVRAKALEHPAGERYIAVGRDPLGIDDAAQPVVVGEVITTGDGLVACGTDRCGDRPRGIELPAPVGIEIAAEA